MIDLNTIKLEYAIPAAFFVAGVLSGYLLNSTSHEVECAQEITNLADCQIKYRERGDKLMRCRAEGVGGAVIDCAPVCAQRVSQALANASAWNCEK